MVVHVLLSALEQISGVLKHFLGQGEEPQYTSIHIYTLGIQASSSPFMLIFWHADSDFSPKTGQTFHKYQTDYDISDI